MIELTDEQVFAIYEMEHWWKTRSKQVFEISGAAGTGKTTLVRYLIDKLGLDNSEVLFVAFMGKAASQLARHGLPAKTIHSAIYNYVKVPDRDDEGMLVFKDNGKPKLISKFVKKKRLGKNIKLIVVDEAPMVDVRLSTDLLSFGIPTIALGDRNQLPPVFGDSIFLQKPDVTLKQIMRQAEDNPIIWISQQILQDKEIPIGVYGNSAVINKKNLTEFHYRNANVVLTGTNMLRYRVNNFFRSQLLNLPRLEYPHVGEKVICRKNNWNNKISTNMGDIYLTNGLTGFVDHVERESFNGTTMKMDFRPDFVPASFKNLKFDYNHLYANPDDETNEEYNPFIDKIEFAYAITVHSSQGSQWDNVLYLAENFMRNREDRMRFNYTAVTRAANSIIIVQE